MFTAENQVNHQSIDPFMLLKKLWLIFMGMKQNRFFWFFFQNGLLKKTEIFKITNFQNLQGLVIGLVWLTDAKGIDVSTDI